MSDQRPTCGAVKKGDGGVRLICNKDAGHVERGDQVHGVAMRPGMTPYVRWNESK